MYSNTAETELEWRTYDHWGSMSGSSMKGSIENTLSRSSRCFQVEKPGEQSHNVNYYSGTGAITPGPGSYSDMNFRPGGPTHSFGSAGRAMSESNRLWAPSDLSVPPPGSYDVEKSSRESYLRNILGVTQWKIKVLKKKVRQAAAMSSTGKISKEERDMQEEIDLLTERLYALKEELLLTTSAASLHASRYPQSKKPAFNSTGRKPHQVPQKIQEAPTFYRSDADWDFGSDKRANTIDMSAFNYSKRVQEDLEVQETTDTDTLVGLKRPPSRCRETDFFGPNSAHRSITPGIGEYTPELVPLNVGGSRWSSGQSTDMSSVSSSRWTKHSNGGYIFNFSRTHGSRATRPGDRLTTPPIDKSRGRRDSGASDLTSTTLLQLKSPLKAQTQTGTQLTSKLTSKTATKPNLTVSTQSSMVSEARAPPLSPQYVLSAAERHLVTRTKSFKASPIEKFAKLEKQIKSNDTRATSL
mmetsp:Transcript_1129/g.1819  ORF Transcript_1129/g.1819 Transcript_1129/m.1819 type:complete len:469 (+) Transcript_1129:115-1521(+)